MCSALDLESSDSTGDFFTLTEERPIDPHVMQILRCSPFTGKEKGIKEISSRSVVVCFCQKCGMFFWEVWDAPSNALPSTSDVSLVEHAAPTSVQLETITWKDQFEGSNAN